MPTNDQYRPGASKFFAAVPEGTGAEGSQGATQAQTMPDDAYRVPATTPYQSVQNQTVPTVGVGLDDTGEPGQLDEGISGLDASFTANTGGGEGHTIARHPNSTARP